MTCLLFSHPDCLDHRPPPGHPERPQRVEAVLRALEASTFAGLVRREPLPAADSAILRCHTDAYLARLLAAEPVDGVHPLDPDTFMSRGSVRAARLAAGAAVAAVDAVLLGEARTAFAATRPPGHHAEKATPMGFCLFGNIAVAARHALDHHGLERVAIADFDVHHGNGTQALLWDEPRIRFVSSHQWPLWPGTGAEDETGAHGQIRNLPLRPGTDGRGFRGAWESEGLPFLHEFEPQLVLVSAGFDAHSADPLGQLGLEADDFRWITARLCDISATYAGGRVVSSLEGGYDLDALAECAAEHVAELMEYGG